MVTIITGKINTNKTTRMIAHYQENQSGDGFVAVKNMIQDTVHSYDAMRLSTKEKRVLVKRDLFFEDDFTVLCSIGPYLFNDDTVVFIEKTIRACVKQNISPIYMDEVGVLELNDRCFHNLLSYLASKEIDLVLSMREDLVDAIVKKYRFSPVEIIKTNGKGD